MILPIDIYLKAFGKLRLDRSHGIAPHKPILLISIFKREVPKIYNYTCCISGMRIDTMENISMVDACHIVPFSESYNDTISSGIALCPNLHRAFDRGLIGIDEDYRVIINSDFTESNKSSYQIKIFEGAEILLPRSRNHFPSQQNLKAHRSRFKFNT